MYDIAQFKDGIAAPPKRRVPTAEEYQSVISKLQEAKGPWYLPTSQASKGEIGRLDDLSTRMLQSMWANRPMEGGDLAATSGVGAVPSIAAPPASTRPATLTTAASTVPASVQPQPSIVSPPTVANPAAPPAMTAAARGGTTAQYLANSRLPIQPGQGLIRSSSGKNLAFGGLAASDAEQVPRTQELAIRQTPRTVATQRDPGAVPTLSGEGGLFSATNAYAGDAARFRGTVAQNRADQNRAKLASELAQQGAQTQGILAGIPLTEAKAQSERADANLKRQHAALIQQLATETDPDKQTEIRRRIAVLSGGKTGNEADRFILADMDTGQQDMMGQPIFRKVPFNTRTGEFMGAGVQKPEMPADPRAVAIAEQVKAGKLTRDEALKQLRALPGFTE